MVTSLSDLCAHVDAVASLVVQADRRQTADRRKTRRGGRRADDINPAVDPLDMRAVAMRRAVPGSNGSSPVMGEHTDRDSRYALATRSTASTVGLAEAPAGHRILE
jgi:hypothetical protein